MPISAINNGDAGSVARQKINDSITIVNLLGDATGAFQITAFANAESASIPVDVDRVFVVDRKAHFKRTASEPDHNLKFESESQWWVVDEPIGYPYMAGVVGDGVIDDTVALQDAINAFSTLVIPQHTVIYITDQIYIPSDRTITGDGTILAGPISGFSGSSSHLSPIASTAEENIRFSGITVDISAWTSTPVGVNSTRCYLIRRSSHITIDKCHFITTGGSVALIGCTDFHITDNYVEVTQPGVAASGFADGVIDCWVEWDIDMTRSVISRNIVKANGWGKWGIMVTGLRYEDQIMEILDIVVSDNIVYDTYYDGIWVFGRDASLDGATVTGNVIDGARVGISLSDARNCVVANNVVKNVTSQGLSFWSENPGVYIGVTDCIIANNVLSNVASNGTSVALYLQHNALRNVVSGNSIVGDDHYYGIVTDSTSNTNQFFGNRVALGRGPRYFSGAVGNAYDGGFYSATLTGVTNITSVSQYDAHFYATDRTVDVRFKLSVTPAASGTTTVAVSLPVPSNITDQALFGSVTSGSITALVIHDSTNDRAQFTFTSAGTGNLTMVGHFTYRIN